MEQSLTKMDELFAVLDKGNIYEEVIASTEKSLIDNRQKIRSVQKRTR